MVHAPKGPLQTRPIRMHASVRRNQEQPLPATETLSGIQQSMGTFTHKSTEKPQAGTNGNCLRTTDQGKHLQLLSHR